jgi:hypothetical protein
MDHNEIHVNENPKENLGNLDENGVQFIGDIPDELLQRPIKYATGPNSKAMDNWITNESTVGRFFTLLTNHRVSKKKDGSSFLQGVSHDGSRKQNAMSEMFMLGLDFDNGETVARLIEKIQAMGVVALIYSTYNHLKGESKVREKAYLNEYAKAGWPKEPTNESLGAFLLKHRKMTPELAATITGFRRDFDGKEGITFFVEHAPLERYRVVLPLEKSFAVATRGGSQKDAIDEWQSRYGALSDIIGVEADKSCVDLSRLFYAPRHPEGKPFAVYVIGGEKFLDIDAIELDSATPPNVTANSAGDVFAQNGNDLGGESRGGGKFAEFPQMPSGENWSDWFATYGKRLKVADLLRERILPEDQRKDDAGKLTVPCAFEKDIHSEKEDGGEDMGFYAMNPDDSDTGAFLLFCSHNSCQHRPMTDFLHAYIQNGVLSEEDLTDERFLCDSPEDKEYAKLLRQARGFGKLTPHSALNRLLSKLAELDISPMQRDEIVGVIADKLKQTRKKIESALDKLTARAASERAAKEENEERLAANKASLNGGEGKPELMLGQDDFDYMTATCWSRLQAVNETKQKYFEIGGRKVRLRDPDPADGRIVPEEFDTKNMVSELNDNIRWIKPGGKGRDQIGKADSAVADQILNQSDLHFPPLVGFVNSPYFSENGDLIAKRGYNASAQMFYNPPAGFELPDLPEPPTLADVKDARALVEEHVFIDFPWGDGVNGVDPDGKSSRAHAWALLLQQFMRPMIPGNLPISFIQKPEMGTGASLLIQSIMRIAFGRVVGTQTEKSSPEEMRKALTAIALSGDPVACFDNLNAHVHGAALANFITCGVWEDRLLGTNQTVRARILCTTILAGNNVAMSPEIARRCVPLVIDAGRDPKERASFRHNLDTWIPEHRAELVRACLVLIRYWISEGCPKWRGKALPSFEGYSRVMGGLLECVGIEGFLGNLALTRLASSADEEPWGEFCARWYDTYGETPRPIGTPFDDGNGGEHDGEKSLVRLIDDHGLSIALKGEKPSDRRDNLGVRMRWQQKVHKHGERAFRISACGRGTDNKQNWQVRLVVADSFASAADDVLRGMTDEAWLESLDEYCDRHAELEPARYGGCGVEV